MSDRDLRTRADMIRAGLSLDEQNDAMLAKLASLKSQIDGAKATAAATGEYGDRDWFNRVNFAYRMLAKEHQAIQREIGERNRKQRKHGGDRTAQAFIEAARRRLDSELFRSLLDEAQQESSQ